MLLPLEGNTLKIDSNSVLKRGENPSTLSAFWSGESGGAEDVGDKGEMRQMMAGAAKVGG